MKKKRVRFSDKVDSIADRLDGTKVPNKYKKEYGGRYSRDEAEESARRIAGAKIRDEKAKPKRKRFEEGGMSDDYSNYEIVLITKELQKDGGNISKVRILVSAQNEEEAKNIAVQMWEKDMWNSDLHIVNVMTDSAYREATQQFRDTKWESPDGYMEDGGQIGGLTADEAIYLYVKKAITQPYREKYLKSAGLWNTPKAKDVEKSLIKKGFLNNAGAINEIGKNKAREVDSSVDMIISRRYIQTNNPKAVYLEILEKFQGSDKMAEGGEVKWQDVYRGDSALVIADNKLGLIIKPYGRKFHLRFPDGTEKTYDASELKFFKFEFADGGVIREIKTNSTWEALKDFTLEIDSTTRYSGKGLLVPKGTQLQWLNDSNNGNVSFKFEIGGKKYEGKIESGNIINVINSGKIGFVKDSKYGIVVYNKEYLKNRLKTFADGGYMAKGGEIQLTNNDIFEKGKIKYYEKVLSVDSKRSPDGIPFIVYNFLIEYEGQMYEVKGSVNENGENKVENNNVPFPLSNRAFQSRLEDDVENGWVTISKYKPYKSKNELLDMAEGGMMADGGDVFDMEDEELDYNNISDLEDELRRLTRWSNQYGKGADGQINQLRKRIEYLKKGPEMAKGGKIPNDLRELPYFEKGYEGAEYNSYSEDEEDKKKSDRWFELMIKHQKKNIKLTKQELEEFKKLSFQLEKYDWE